MGYGFGAMGLFGLIPLVLIGLIIYAVVKLTQRDNYNNRGEHDALDMLNQRFANGEISEEEYTRKKKLLRD